jgi:hypothetical protein
MATKAFEGGRQHEFEKLKAWHLCAINCLLFIA